MLHTLCTEFTSITMSWIAPHIVIITVLFHNGRQESMLSILIINSIRPLLRITPTNQRNISITLRISVTLESLICMCRIALPCCVIKSRLWHPACEIAFCERIHIHPHTHARMPKRAKYVVQIRHITRTSFILYIYTFTYIKILLNTLFTLESYSFYSPASLFSIWASFAFRNVRIQRVNPRES